MSLKTENCIICGIPDSEYPTIRGPYIDGKCYPCRCIEIHKQMQGCGYVPGTKWKKCKDCKTPLIFYGEQGSCPKCSKKHTESEFEL